MTIQYYNITHHDGGSFAPMTVCRRTAPTPVYYRPEAAGTGLMLATGMVSNNFQQF